MQQLYRVASFTDAWIETKECVKEPCRKTSHLLQMRGLKPQERQDLFFCHQSHLLQMRGLKPESNLLLAHSVGVASFTDAWIETGSGDEDVYTSVLESHLLQMRGLKPATGAKIIGYSRRIFYRCVD